ncbi:tail assembly chaperone [Mycobacterium phage Lakes]|uniref:Tail assembly chaperone n=3 Tax=Mycobacterium phage D29 TaxID=28369 RepID=A0A8T8JE88_BPMD2|nr:tail assembly chaperone [Mycobacterium phage D29]AAC18466.2 tail assembly chaperone [Mycobacterium phage D29]QFG08792.1 tail assembly chaperone [Mycobacterium phage Naji]QJD52471.1 tail assembly chaperone [Mycobacterium phage D32]QUE25981.1 tail assembly chaperone [Mycobacterium phage Lakes]
MTNVFTIDAFREEVKKKYEPVTIGISEDVTVELKPLLKLGQKAREAVVEAVKEVEDIPDIDEDDEEAEELVDEYSLRICEIVAKVFRLIATKPKKLIAALDEEEDPRIRAELYATVLRTWMVETQLGGSRALAELIDKFGGAILSDLSEYHGVDLRDLFRDEDPLSPRYVLNLVIHLPKTGAFYAERRGGQQYRGWDEDRYALADIYDAVQAGNHILLMANRDPKKPKPKAPKAYPRPDDFEKTTPKPGSFAAMVVAAKKAAREKREREEANAE